jgi:uncharacterized delta-60 repeat protein
MLDSRVRRTGSGATAGLRLTAFLVLVGGLALITCNAASAASSQLDLSFGGAAHGRVMMGISGATKVSVTGTAVQPRGGVVVVGYDDHGGGDFDGVVFRLLPDGRRDTRFGTVRLRGLSGDDAFPHAVRVQPNGKILVVGAVFRPTGDDDVALWRLSGKGHLDPRFGSGGLAVFGAAGTSEVANAVTLDEQGRVLVGGHTNVNGDADMMVMRFTPAGRPDQTFNGNKPLYALPAHAGADVVRAMAMQPDGKVVLTGAYSLSAGITVARVVPGNSRTVPAVLDGGFGAGGLVQVRGTSGGSDNPGVGVVVLRDGSIVALGSAPASGRVQPTLVRLRPDGTVDDSYSDSSAGPGIHLETGAKSSLPVALALLPSQGVAVVAQNSASVPVVAVIDEAGHPDPAIGPSGAEALADGLVRSVATGPHGRIVVTVQPDPQHAVIYRLVGELTAPRCGGKRATIVGTKAADTLVGTEHADVISGLRGRDTITGLEKGDIICGGGGNDHIRGGLGVDQLYGGPGHDRLFGGPGHDRLFGGPGHDTIKQ